MQNLLCRHEKPQVLCSFLFPFHKCPLVTASSQMPYITATWRIVQCKALYFLGGAKEWDFFLAASFSIAIL